MTYGPRSIDLYMGSGFLDGELSGFLSMGSGFLDGELSGFLLIQPVGSSFLDGEISDVPSLFNL